MMQTIAQGAMNDAALDARHAEKMRTRQAARTKIQATKTIEKAY